MTSRPESDAPSRAAPSSVQRSSATDGFYICGLLVFTGAIWCAATSDWVRAGVLFAVSCAVFGAGMVVEMVAADDRIRARHDRDHHDHHQP